MTQPPMSQPPLSPGYAPAPRGGANALAIISLIVGIVSIVVFCAPWAGIALGALAVVLGIVGRTQPTGKGMALAGIILGVAGIIIGIVVWAAFRKGVSFLKEKSTELQQKAEEMRKKAEEEQRKAQQQNQGTQPSSTAPIQWNIASTWPGLSDRTLLLELSPVPA